jgi:hypothetical protein
MKSKRGRGGGGRKSSTGGEKSARKKAPTAAEKAAEAHAKYVESIYPRLTPEEQPFILSINRTDSTFEFTKTEVPKKLAEFSIGCNSHIPFIGDLSSDTSTGEAAIEEIHTSIELLAYKNWGYKDGTTGMLIQYDERDQWLRNGFCIFRGVRKYATGSKFMTIFPGFSSSTPFMCHASASVTGRTVCISMAYDQSARSIRQLGPGLKLRTSDYYSKTAELHFLFFSDDPSTMKPLLDACGWPKKGLKDGYTAILEDGPRNPGPPMLLDLGVVTSGALSSVIDDIHTTTCYALVFTDPKLYIPGACSINAVVADIMKPIRISPMESSIPKTKQSKHANDERVSSKITTTTTTSRDDADTEIDIIDSIKNQLTQSGTITEETMDRIRTSVLDDMVHDLSVFLFQKHCPTKAIATLISLIKLRVIDREISNDPNYALDIANAMLVTNEYAKMATTTLTDTMTAAATSLNIFFIVSQLIRQLRKI